ncbi:MAG: hypothetical protein KAU21_02510, partial [Gammaproteobacteria bacterium]|nr:hypothetical protein [Gammaproteobacteria bacterium]
HQSNEVSQVHRFNKDPYWDKPYKEHFVHIDPWINILQQAENSFIGCNHHYISDQDYETTELHTDFLAPQKIFHGMAGLIRFNPTHDAYIVFHRRKDKGGYEDHLIDTLELFGEHIQQALLINEKTRQVDFENHLLKDSLNQISSPVLLMDKFGQVLFINAQAEAIIEQQSHAIIKGNSLRLLCLQHNKKLTELIYRATNSDAHHASKQGGAMSYTNPTDLSKLYILVNPVSPDLVNGYSMMTDCAMVFLASNTQKTILSVNLIKDMYNLSPAEARLTELLCEGLTLIEVSKKLEVGVSTLRTQLRSCFNKTGVERQSQLISLVNSGPVGKAV